MLDFAVTGIARSRTAWFAAFLTDGISHCWHDWSAQVLDPADYLKAAVPGKQSGISDTGFWMLGRRADKYAKRIVVIHRNPAECRESAHRAFGVDMDMVACANALYQVPGFHLKYDSLADHAVLEEAFHYLTGRKADPERVELFANLNIQTNIGHEVIQSITDKHFISRGIQQCLQ